MHYRNVLGDLVILTKDWHSGEYELPVQYPIHRRRVWSDTHNFHWAEAVQELAPDKLDSIALTALMKSLDWPDTTEEFLATGFIEDSDWQGNYSINSYFGKPTEWRSTMWLMMQYIKSEAAQVGGDDSYYDYFPGVMEEFLDICIALQKVTDLDGYGYYKEAYDSATRSRYFEDDEETLPKWPEDITEGEQ